MPEHQDAPSIDLTVLRERVRRHWRPPEAECLAPLVSDARLDDAEATEAVALARRLVEGLRAARPRAGGVDALMQEFSLSSQEGVALMCLAESLLRIPDRATADRLIRDKLRLGHWEEHLGHSPSLFVNAAAWGLLITGRLVARDEHGSRGLGAALGRLLRRGGEPLIRGAMDLAMRLLGEQFVAGHTIDEALDRCRRRAHQGYLYSFDMLGEAAMNAADAQSYFQAYEAAIHAIGQEARGRGPIASHGISIKISALHPRYTWSQPQRLMAEIAPRLVGLCQLARQYDIAVHIDAEESERLEPSLDLLAVLLAEPSLTAWDGIGFVVQAYQKRAPAVLDWLIAAAHQSGRRLLVRLVKGAYWDTEIKRAQIEGLTDYPVYSRKAHTDLAYLACARRLLAARDRIYPQFATHNAHTLAAVRAMGGAERDDYEFQCLHGMGESLYDQLVGPGGVRCRIYAPVGSHRTLLAYLVRRLLENGANSSFVNRVVDPSLSIDALVADPVAQALAGGLSPEPRIPAPPQLFAPERANSHGLDLADPAVRAPLLAALDAARRAAPVTASPQIAADAPPTRPPRAITHPARPEELVGWVVDADPPTVATALTAATEAAASWAATPVGERAACLDRTAALLEDQRGELMTLLVREAGKTWPAALAEVREAVDFCRYYAARAREDWAARPPRSLGPVACISPWNFPLAIFAGQVGAALIAGNPVLAKPAEQTPLIAARAVALFHQAGVPRAVLQCLPGPGETVGAALVAAPAIQGVAFTGSTAVARLIHQTLARRGDLPLVAETGGMNAMVVDSTALPEQLVADVLTSAFDSAGQRCSALRVLCLQDDIAGTVLHMLRGAMAELRVAPPESFATDLGPLIDEPAKTAVAVHVEAMLAAGCQVFRHELEEECASGHFMAPTLIEVDSIDRLPGEVFGPVLHVVRYRRQALPALMAALRRTGYGLTFGVHTRIDEAAATLIDQVRAGNIYLNRNMIGAVVGVQPFGGEGLSGTGPKAGGPFYLGRFVRGDPGPTLAGSARPSAADPGLEALAAWVVDGGWTALGLTPLDAAALEADVEHYRIAALTGLALPLPGPTGESNRLELLPRGTIRCIAHAPAGWLHQAAAVLATGNQGEFDPAPGLEAFLAALPPTLSARLGRAGEDDAVAAILCDAPAAESAAHRQAWAAQPGPLRPFLAPAPRYDLLRLVRERTVSVNTAAAGGNVALMALGS